MRRRIATWAAMLAALITMSMMTAAPASAADRLPNPSGEWPVGCSGAWSSIQVDWKSDTTVTIRWLLKDTMADGKSPVLRIQAQMANGDSAKYIFRNDQPYFILSGGKGAITSGAKENWNPVNLGDINHLWVEVESGTNDQGEKCQQRKEIYNWTRIGYDNALEQRGAPYQLGGTGPAYDCSGLVYDSYNRIPIFPDWPVRSSQQMYDWVRTHGNASKFYAVRVDYSDLKIGDLIFYNTIPGNANLIDHVAFYSGNGTVFDAQQPGVPVGNHDDYTGSRVAAYRILGVSIV